MMQVKEVMSRQVVSLDASDSSLETVTVGPDETLGEAAWIMLERKVGSLPVLEDGRVVGILTETDMLRLIVRSDVCAPECAEVIASFP